MGIPIGDEPPAGAEEPDLYHPPAKGPTPTPALPGGASNIQGFNLDDPLLAALFGDLLADEGAEEQTPRDLMIAQLSSVYFRLWGIPPPEGYVEKQVDAGVNVYEFEMNERMKPAFRLTMTFRDQQSSFAQVAAQIMGTRQ
jgi:hypothetical protein